MKKVAIIGGGLGGLATAARLAAKGHPVTLCEAGPRLGGKMNVLEHQGWRFDTGPSLITMPHVFAETFAAAGARIEDHLQLERLEPVAEYIWPDGTRLTHSAQLPHWLETIRQLEPRDVAGFMRFLKLGARLFELSDATFLRRAMDAPPDWRTLAALRHLPLRRAWGNYARAVEGFFHSPHLRQMFNRYPTYVGSSPWRSPATLLVIPYLEIAFGGWFVKGGLYRIVEALAGVARSRGAELMTNAAVERVTHSSGRVKGVRLADGRNVDADIVVMNGDAGYLDRLLGRLEQAELPPAQRSMSGYLLLAGSRRRLHGTHHHTVCFSADYRAEFRQLIDERRFPDDPTVYVNMPSRSDPSVAPEGCEGLFIMANAPADSALDTSRSRERVVARLEASGFATDFEVFEHWTPQRMARAYHMPGGAIYGQASHGWRGAFLRPANRQRRTRGLYLVGGSGHPGGGTPTVLISARITSDLIGRHESA